ncbi:hypothetical protein Arcpr_1858 (plasmid) [Archaeoglobus profundus DSM 5631]|uniref:Uncharacterized protein n=2 Tax=Archaeoglobus profundus TaxID=84156 RepID=D2RIC8_ARCPA|nr:hypothetical protein Arcpr_1858 [Archaeoglobus profundus DSM 5631]
MELFDGANASVSDYIKKYIIKNLNSALEGTDKEKDPKLAWYWLVRVPFYTISPKLRKPQENPPPLGLVFLGSYSEWDLSYLLV